MTSTATLPAPPNSEPYWSIVTLAAWLCVPAWKVEQHLTVIPEDSKGDSPDIVRARIGHSYSNPTDRYNEDRGDCYLHADAAERIATALPIGLIARQIVADPCGTDVAADLTALDVRELAEHIVALFDGGDPR